jgi:KipI family sensor histidine kinase inhibitor
MRLSFTFLDCAESSLVVSFGPHYSKDLSLEILDLSRRLQTAGLLGLKESIPALSSLTIFYDPLQLPRERLAAAVEELTAKEHTAAPESRTWNIPVVYGEESGPDLKEIAGWTGMSERQIIDLHAGQTYHVYMLGFLPGFAYLGDLVEPLHLPRRTTPRARVPAGSVAIASGMTAVYSLESPGGWHLIGTSPIVFWDMARYDEPLLKPGDRVRFSPIMDREAAAIRNKAGEGWRPEPVEVA